MSNVTVSILILTYNRVSLSKECLPKILDNIGSIDHEVLIWDNGSADGTYDWLCDFQRCDDRITELIGSDCNIGMEGINYLAEHAKGKFIIKVDDDLILPKNFAQRMVEAYEQVNEPHLLFLSWDMGWPNGTFATRSGLFMYKGSRGRMHSVGVNDRVFITYDPNKWMVNGACRLSPREKFLEVGGHPQGMFYGIDKRMSEIAAEHGYYVGYLNSHDLVKHCGGRDSPAYRQFKNKELKKAKGILHV